MARVTCAVRKIENGFIVDYSSDPNNYSNPIVYEDGPLMYAPVEAKTLFAGSPEEVGKIIAEVFS